MPVEFASMRFLIIDDMSEAKNALRLTLSTFGVVHTHFSSTGVDAMRRLAASSYDVILCDYMLGDGKDGQQVLEEIRHRNLIGRSTVFIMITAERAYQRVISAVELAPDDYLIKPFNGEMLQLRILRAIEKKTHFAVVYGLIDAHEFPQAIAECERNVAAKSRHSIDFLRLHAELLLLIGKPEDAKAIYEQILATHAVPWAKMGLGKALFEQARFEEAEAVFLALTTENEAFTQGYDWLAKTYQARGEDAKAQETIARAVSVSPNTVVRQQKLGQVAYRNKDLDTAERAFKSSIQLARYSVFKSADDYVGLSKSLLDKGDTQKALEIVRTVPHEFPGDAAASLHAIATESVIHKKTGNADAAKKAFDKAMDLYETHKDDIAGSVALNVAETCLHFDQKDAANDIVKTLAKNADGDPQMLKDASAVYTNFGMQEHCDEAIRAGVKEAAQLNNEAVVLAREGKLEEAITLLRQAADTRTSSVTVKLNAAQAILMLMAQQGWNADYARYARDYLRAAREADPNSAKLHKLTEHYRGVAAKHGIRNAV